MLAPQSPDEVDAIVRELRTIDSRFFIEWDPRAILLQPGAFDANGARYGQVYAGRWDLRLAGEANAMNDYRGYERVCFITEPVDMGEGVRGMKDEGAYAPVGLWLVDFIKQIDYQNREGMAAMAATLEQQNDRRQRSSEETREEYEREMWEREFFRGTMEGGHSESFPVPIQLTTS